MKNSSVPKPIYRKNKELSGISDIDRGVVPLVKALNRWRKHAGGYYTGIATTFSCGGKAYVSFHLSRKQAEALADCVREFRQGKEWIVNFYTHTYEVRSTDFRAQNPR